MVKPSHLKNVEALRLQFLAQSLELHNAGVWAARSLGSFCLGCCLLLLLLRSAFGGPTNFRFGWYRRWLDLVLNLILLSAFLLWC